MPGIIHPWHSHMSSPVRKENRNDDNTGQAEGNAPGMGIFRV